MHAAVARTEWIKPEVPGPHALDKGEALGHIKPFGLLFQGFEGIDNLQMGRVFLSPFGPVIISFIFAFLIGAIEISRRLTLFFFKFTNDLL